MTSSGIGAMPDIAHFGFAVKYLLTDDNLHLHERRSDFGMAVNKNVLMIHPDETIDLNEHNADRDVREFLSFRLTRLSQISDAVGQRWLSSEYGLRLIDWRVIGLTAVLKPARFRDIAQILFTDKGQLSRIISSLNTKGLIIAKPDPMDNRGRLLFLTDEGQQTFEKIRPGAAQRNSEMISGLTDDERATLKIILDKLEPFMDKRIAAIE